MEERETRERADRWMQAAIEWTGPRPVGRLIGHARYELLEGTRRGARQARRWVWWHSTPRGRYEHRALLRYVELLRSGSGALREEPRPRCAHPAWEPALQRGHPARFCPDCGTYEPLSLVRGQRRWRVLEWRNGQ